MNEILPRISPNGTGTRRIVLLNGGRHPSNVGRDGHNVLPRIGGGVSAKVVLANAGINRGPLVRVTAWKASAESKGNEEAARKRAAKVAEEIKQGAAKVTFHKVEKKKQEEGTGLRAEKEPITEEETRLADLLEAAQEVKPIVDERLAETDMPEMTSEEFPELKALEMEEAVGYSAEELKAEETAAVIPEVRIEEMPRKKRRGRKGRKARAEMMSAEQGLL